MRALTDCLRTSYSSVSYRKKKLMKDFLIHYLKGRIMYGICRIILETLIILLHIRESLITALVTRLKKPSERSQ